MLPFAKTLAVLCLGISSAFRKHDRKGGREAGQIDGLFPFAAVPSAQPGLLNARGGPCFPGVRSANIEAQWYGQDVDTITLATAIFGFGHPWMDLQLNDVGDSSKSGFYSCVDDRENIKERPMGFAKYALHDYTLYMSEMQSLDLGWGDLMYDLSQLALPMSYTTDTAVVNETAQGFGYDLIGTALDGGSPLYVGEQVSHLLQDTSSQECILTFMGTISFQDWTANMNVQKVSWCGLASEDAAIDPLDVSSTLPNGESLVHAGFKDALMYIVNSSSWQSDIKPKLSTCSKLYVTGHSLGAAQAELFAACVQKAPGVGEYGYDDYKFMEF